MLGGNPVGQAVKLILTGGHVSLAVAFKGPNVTLGLCTHNYSLTRGKELALPLGTDKVLGRVQGGGPDSA